MIIRRQAHPHAGAAAGERQPQRSRKWRYLFFIVGTGTVSGLAALTGVWPFGGLQTYAAQIGQIVHPPAGSTPIHANSIFPPVQPVHKTIDVYDPPPPVNAAPPASPSPAPPTQSPRPHHSPSPSPGSTPPVNSSPSPSPKDD